MSVPNQIIQSSDAVSSDVAVQLRDVTVPDITASTCSPNTQPRIAAVRRTMKRKLSRLSASTDSEESDVDESPRCKTVVVKQSASQWRVLIDSREPADIRQTYTAAVLKRVDPLETVGVDTATLDTADYAVQLNGCDVMLVERKTLSDLVSSIKSDGRYNHQPARMQLTAAPYLVYLIVASDSALRRPDASFAASAMVHLSLLPRMCVVRVSTETEGASWLSTAVRYLVREFRPSLGTIDAWKTAHQTNTHKQKFNSFDTVYTGYLTLIEGMSAKKARVVADAYPGGIQQLLRAWQALPASKRSTMLAALEIDSDKSGGKPRKLGKVLSARVYQCTVGPNE